MKKSADLRGLLLLAADTSHANPWYKHPRWFLAGDVLWTTQLESMDWP